MRGSVAVMGLAEQAGLSELIGEKVVLRSTAVRSAGVNPAVKLTSIIAGMAAGADSIDDLQVVRSGGMTQLFTGVYAPATLGQFLREFSHGHTRQLGSVAQAHLVNLAARTEVLAGIEEQAFVDIDSLLRPVFGHAKGASFGHTKIAGRQVLRRAACPRWRPRSAPRPRPRSSPGSGCAPGGLAPAGARTRWSPRRSPPPAPPERSGRSWSRVRQRPSGRPLRRQGPTGALSRRAGQTRRMILPAHR